MKPVIFLDIDGVLNSVQSSIAYHYLCNGMSAMYSEEDRLDEVSVGLLKMLVDTTDANIVISSSWRINRQISDFIRIFNLYKWHDAPVIGMTGRGKYGSCRGDEIQEYIDMHSIIDYVILDDDTDMLRSQRDNFVHCKGVYGLRLLEAQKAVSILTGKVDKDIQAHLDFKYDKN